MCRKLAAPILLAILPLGVSAQTVWVIPDPYQSPGGSIVDGIEAGQRYMQRQQEMEDRRRQRELDRQEQLDRMERQREMDQEQREMAEQRRQLQQLRAEIESQRPAAQQQSTRAQATSEPRPQTSTTIAQRSGEPLRCGAPYAAVCPPAIAAARAAEAARASARDVPIRDDPEGQKWCGEQGGIVSDDGRHCRLP